LENQYESYLARKAAMSKKTSKKKKSIVKIQRIQPEALDALQDIISQPALQVPYDIFREHLYSATDLYRGYHIGKVDTFKDDAKFTDFEEVHNE
jgi:hypothetical protein